MGYTMSMDASVRIKRHGMGGYLRHMFRDCYEAEGIHLNHANDNIDPERTADNVSLIYDDEIGDLRPPRNHAEIGQAILAPLDKIEGTLRKDAVVIRPIIFQLGNGYYDDYPDGTEDEEGNPHTEFDRVYEWACNQWGKSRIRAVSIHMDESNPHMELMLTGVSKDPITGKYSNNQKSIINGAADLKRLHRSLRNYMIESGYDVEIENQPNSHPHYKDAEYKRMQDRKKATEAAYKAAEALKQQTAKDLQAAKQMASESGIAADMRVWMQSHDMIDRNGRKMSIWDAYNRDIDARIAQARRPLPDISNLQQTATDTIDYDF